MLAALQGSSEPYRAPDGRLMRPKTLLERQPYIVAYGAGISVFSPYASIYQMVRLNPEVVVTNARMMSLAARVFPIQTLLKSIQMNIGTKVKEVLNPWAAFAVVGILQGGVYGQCNIFFSKELGIAKKASLLGMFRGVAFAAGRDTISQGVPFMCSAFVKKHVIEAVFPTDEHTSDTIKSVKQWASVLSTSVVSTYASQFFQNCQITMQANQELGYAGTLQHVFKRNGMSVFYKGAEARVGLLIVVNVLNELLLKPAWEGVELQEEVKP
jgi:hypothetical protein